MDLLRACLVGAAGTPYHDNLFFFDIFFPPDYPHEPPVSSSFFIALTFIFYSRFSCCWTVNNHVQFFSPSLFTTIPVASVWTQICMSLAKCALACSKHGQELVVKCGTLKIQLFFNCCCPFKLLFSMKNLTSMRLAMTNSWGKQMERRTPSLTMRTLSCCHASPWRTFYTSHQRCVSALEILYTAISEKKSHYGVHTVVFFS